MEGELAFRPRWRQLPWWMALYPATYLFQPGPDRLSGARIGLVVALTLGIGAELLWLSRTGVVLRPDAVVVRGIRKRVVPWRDVWWIGPYPQLGMQAVGIRTHDDLYRLRAPVHMPVLAPDREFRAKAQTIYDYWVSHRGPDWAPPAYGWRPPAP